MEWVQAETVSVANTQPVRERKGKYEGVRGRMREREDRGEMDEI